MVCQGILCYNGIREKYKGHRPHVIVLNGGFFMPAILEKRAMIKFGDTTYETQEYAAFVEKFKPKKTTDDCYTPSNLNTRSTVILTMSLPRPHWIEL